MSRRNFTLLIIVLGVLVVLILGYLYFFYTPSAPGAGGGEGTNFWSTFNPFRRKPPATTPPPIITPDENPPGTGSETEAPKILLRKVSSMPVAGYTVFQKERFKEIPQVATPTETTSTATSGTATSSMKPSSTTSKPSAPPTEFATALRYVDRATGNIYQTFADKIDERKFSSNTIPAVYEAFFGNNGGSVLMRYLKNDDKTIETFTGTLPNESVGADTILANDVKGVFLPENVTDVSVSSDTKKVFYLFNTESNGVENAFGVILDLLTGKKSQIFSSPFTEWLSYWPNSKMITLTTKPSASVPGYMYAINTDRKDFTKVLGDISGLTTLTSPDGKQVLYADSSASLFVYNISTKNSSSLSIKTLPEKCVWGGKNDVIYCAVPRSTGGGYPDPWYKGEVSFSDQLWKVELATGTTVRLVDPFDIPGGEDMDGIKLTLDATENYLFFVNKKDSFLWEYILR